MYATQRSIWSAAVQINVNVLHLPFHRVKAYIANGWDKNIVDPDPQKKYTLRKDLSVSQPKTTDDNCTCTAGANTNEWDGDGWPKGAYTQQIEGVLPAILTDNIVTISSPLVSECIRICIQGNVEKLVMMMTRAWLLILTQTLTTQLFRGAIVLHGSVYPGIICSFLS